MITDTTYRPLQGRRILVVEDEYYIADDLARALAERGAHILGPSPSRQEALRFIQHSDPIDLAILDLNLQAELTLSVADLLAKKEIPFIFATGYDEFHLPERYRHVPRWEKPFSSERLADSCERLLK
jgi:two-component SAPR family response regulator